MDERVTSPADLPARSPLPLTSYILKLERDAESMESGEESNPLEQEDEYAAMDSEEETKLMEPQKEFILTFESLEVLWDPRNPFYTNKYKRKKALAKLVPILRKMKSGATIEDVKKKINSLRSNFRRHLRKAMLSQQAEDPSDFYRPKIWYYPYLDFLRKLEERTSRETEKREENEGKSQNRVESEIPQVGISFSPVKIPEQPSVLLSRARKRTIHRSIANTSQTPQNIPDLKPSIESCPPKTVSNHIVLEWVETLEKLDPMQRLYAKKAINDVLFEAELGNLHKHSVKINEPSPYDPSTSFLAHSSKSPPTQSSF